MNTIEFNTQMTIHKASDLLYEATGGTLHVFSGKKSIDDKNRKLCEFQKKGASNDTCSFEIDDQTTVESFVNKMEETLGLTVKVWAPMAAMAMHSSFPLVKARTMKMYNPFFNK